MKKMKAFLSLSLCGTLLVPWISASWAQQLDTDKKAVHGQIAISRELNIAPAADKVSLNLRDASLRDVLNMLANQGKFNLIMDDSVTGTLTVDIKNITINKALEHILSLEDLSLTKDGGTVLVTSKTNAENKNLNARTLKAIPVFYKDATAIATELNNTIFKVSRPGGSKNALAAADPDSNTIVVMGTDADLRLVNSALKELDVPRNRKVYNIRHNTPIYVAQVLAANFFSNQPSVSIANLGGGGAGGATGGAAGGGGAGGATGGAAGGGGAGGATGGAAGGGGTAGGAAGGATGGGAGGATGGAGATAGGVTGGLQKFNSGGVTFIAEPIGSTLTILGTEAQIAMVDSIIDQVDVQRPQVVIEVSLVEVQSQDLKSLQPLWGAFNLSRQMSLNFNTSDGAGGNTGLNLFTFNPAANNKMTTITPSFSMTQGHEVLQGKVLANPTIVAMDGTNSTITITDQVPNISQNIATGNNGVPVITNTIQAVDVGITLGIKPQISNDGSVVLQLQPDVTQPGNTIKSGQISTTLISKRTMNLAGVRVKDGETLVIGGLIRESVNLDKTLIPGIENMPIVSAMFRNIKQNNKTKTELVLMVTPHILKEDAISYFHNAPTGKTPSLNQGPGGISPPQALLPPLTGSSAVSLPVQLNQIVPERGEPDLPLHQFQKIELNQEPSKSKSFKDVGPPSTLKNMDEVIQN